MKIHQRLILLLIFIFGLVTLTFAIFNPQSIIKQSLEIDFIGHFIGFYLLIWFLHKKLSLPLINIGICLIFYGAITELSQLYLGFRNGEISDYIADVLGISLYMAIKWITFQEHKIAKA
jgi:VanZ family protein